MVQTAFASHRFKRYYQSLEPLFQSRQAQAYTMIAVSLLCIIFFGIFAIKPTLKTITVLQRKIIDSTDLNQKLEAKINALIQAQDAYEKIKPDLPLIYSLLPDTPEFPSLLRRIENLAQAHDATLSGIQFDPIVLYTDASKSAAPIQPEVSPSANATIPLNFTLNFGGSYQNLMSVLEELTNLDRLVTIYAADISLAEESEAQSALSVTVQSSSYYFPASN